MSWRNDKLYLLNLPEDNNYVLYFVRVVCYEENDFWKNMVLSQVKSETK